jgi:hypothetical protein
VGRPLRRPRKPAGDKGYSYRHVRQRLRGIAAVIPTRKDQPKARHFYEQAYRRRNVVERLVNWLKERHRLAT